MGIDYGYGQTNIDLENGIRYGIISLNSGVLQSWCDESEPFYPCADCEASERGEETCENLDCEPSSFYYEADGYLAESCFDGAEIMIMKSPFYTYGAFCSPCVPGAINIDVLGDDDKAYCFGHDWFDAGKAPYRVFSVETGKEVLS